MAHVRLQCQFFANMLMTLRTNKINMVAGACLCVCLRGVCVCVLVCVCVCVLPDPGSRPQKAHFYCPYLSLHLERVKVENRTRV